MPGHKTIGDTETSNRLVKQESELASIREENACGISVGVAKKAVYEELDQQRTQHELRRRNWTQTGKTFPAGAFKLEKWKELLKLNGNQLQLVVGLLEGSHKKDNFQVLINKYYSYERCLRRKSHQYVSYATEKL